MFKSFYILFILGALFTSFQMEAALHKENMPMEGQLDQDGPRSSLHPVQVFLDESTLTLEFAQYVPDVTVSIKDNSGNLIYIKSYTAPGTEIISLADLEPGSYMLELTTERGGYMYGSFFYN